MANFSMEIINLVWDKGIVVDGYDKSKYRKDNCGAWMQKSKLNTQETFGWEIDNVYPVTKGGDDALVNLRPMHWQNKRSKNDAYPSYQCVIKAKESLNVASEETCIVNQELQIELEMKYKVKR